MRSRYLTTLAVVIAVIIGVGVCGCKKDETVDEETSPEESSKQLMPLSPNARLEVKIAEKESAEGLTPITLEQMRGETLYVHEEADLTTSDFAGVYMSKDNMGRPAIMVVLTKAGGERMWQMSRANINRHVVILINGQAVSAPVINSAIRKKFVISISREEEADRLFQKLTQP